MSLLYQLMLGMALLIAGPILLLRRGTHYLPTLAGRLGLALPPPMTAGGLWIHAVSVGEAAVAATLAARLPRGLPLVVTTITPTGQQRAQRLLGDRAAIAFLPVDLGLPLERFLDRVQPSALVLVEGDYWPEMLRRCRRRGVRVAVVNGRVGDRSMARWARVPGLARRLLGTVERFAVQTPEDARRLLALGVEPGRVTVAGNLKFEAGEPPPLPALEARLAALAGGRPVLVAGSTMPGEEQAVLTAFVRLGGGHRALLVLAPRHPERWEEVSRLLTDHSLAWLRRSALDEGLPPAAEGPPAVVLLDSLGELAALYRLATASFVGGTLSGTGGHNPLEPARFATPLAVGPSMENFRDVAEQFDRAAAWRRVAGAEELAAAWSSWLEDPGAAAVLGQRARRLVEANQGALSRTLDLLASMIPGVSTPELEPARGPDGSTRPALERSATEP